MPPCEPATQTHTHISGNSTAVTTVTLPADAPAVAFLVHARLVAAVGGAAVLPVLWSDNFVTLRPGESRVLTAQFGTAQAPPGGVKVVVEAFNNFL